MVKWKPSFYIAQVLKCTSHSLVCFSVSSFNCNYASDKIMYCSQIKLISVWFKPPSLQACDFRGRLSVAWMVLTEVTTHAFQSSTTLALPTSTLSAELTNSFASTWEWTWNAVRCSAWTTYASFRLGCFSEKDCCCCRSNIWKHILEIWTWWFNSWFSSLM